ncbi:MAG: hypothetical protein M3396_00910 [Actinomycetota bacterium]|nr:hypothetical protein [Actinomycetota bacterium]
MSSVLTPQPRAPLRRRSDILVVLTGALVLVGVVAVLVPATKTAGHVASITITNPHRWPAGVEAAAENRQGWVGIGAVDASGTRAFEEVLDQGRVWVFRFSYAGVDGGELVVSRAELEGSQWKVTVPDEFANRLGAAGLGPSAG